MKCNWFEKTPKLTWYFWQEKTNVHPTCLVKSVICNCYAANFILEIHYIFKFTGFLATPLERSTVIDGQLLDILFIFDLHRLLNQIQ